jgi:hypothetical protein
MGLTFVVILLFAIGLLVREPTLGFDESTNEGRGFGHGTEKISREGRKTQREGKNSREKRTSPHRPL